MTYQQEFLLSILLVSGSLSLIYSAIDQEKAKRLNTWYHVLRDRRDEYDFEKTTMRKRKTLFYFACISASGIILSLLHHYFGIVFGWISIASLAFAMYYLYPVKK